MTKKFKNVPVDADTKIIYEQTMKFGDEDVLYQKWNFDGISAESIIFIDSDVEHLSDEALKAYVSESDIVKNKTSMTISRSSTGYAFVNFNFEA